MFLVVIDLFDTSASGYLSNWRYSLYLLAGLTTPATISKQPSIIANLQIKLPCKEFTPDWGGEFTS